MERTHHHRLPGALASHTSYNPHSMLQHEPTDPTYSYNLPPGVEYAAMDLQPYEWQNLTPMEQKWKRYQYERNLRNPDHILQGLDVEYWEAESEYPLLVPRRQDFKTYENYIHASRDFSIELHRLQMKADALRARDHPKLKHYLESIFKDRRLEKGMQTMGVLASLKFPLFGAALGLGSSLSQYGVDSSRIKQ